MEFIEYRCERFSISEGMTLEIPKDSLIVRYIPHTLTDGADIIILVPIENNVPGKNGG
jgi:hypothetical protein